MYSKHFLISHKHWYVEIEDTPYRTIHIPDDTTEYINDDEPSSKRRYTNKHLKSRESVNISELDLLGSDKDRLSITIKEMTILYLE